MRESRPYGHKSVRDAVLAVVAARQRDLVTMFMSDEEGTREPCVGRVPVVKL